MHFCLYRLPPDDIFVLGTDSKRTQDAPGLNGGVGAI
jgi:hypothetical protein